MEHSGSRALIPYVLSFVSSLYWNQRTGIVANLKQMSDGEIDDPIGCTAFLLPQAGRQAVVSGPANILLVYSLHVCEADYEVRMARALELVMPGRPSICPRQEASLSWWLSGNAIVMAGLSYGAFLAFGLDWAMVNGLVCLNSDLMTSVKRLLPLCTNGRVQNCVEAKRRLYLDGCDWSYSKMTKNLSSDNVARSLKKVSGMPLPMFLIKAIMNKMGLELRRPEVERTYYDFDEGEDSMPTGVLVPVKRGWTFAPWVCDTIDYVRSKFSVVTNAPDGKADGTAELGVWPYAWADNVSCWGSGTEDVDLPGRIRLMTNAVSGRFYSEAFLQRDTIVYVTNNSPSGVPGREPEMDLAMPDPSTGAWQRAWSQLRGRLPTVVAGAGPRMLECSLPGAPREIAGNVEEPSLD
ncbi:hypothetical protein MTO96_050618 [Rhipicephalus appendiculatus]